MARDEGVEHTAAEDGFQPQPRLHPPLAVDCGQLCIDRKPQDVELQPVSDAQTELLLQIHPQWGLWHALWHAMRFALVRPAVDAADARALLAQRAPAGCDICLTCDGKPCLHPCPVDAFGPGSYDVPACADHLHRPVGAQCMQHGCLARRACPVAVELRYEPPHAAVHMQVFAQRH